MAYLNLTPPQWDGLLRCCQGVLINRSTSPADLRHFLLNRLGETQRATAGRICQLSSKGLRSLRAQIAAHLARNAPSPW
jgi:hypothetical protein